MIDSLTSARGQFCVPVFSAKTRNPIITLQSVALVTGEVQCATLVVLLTLNLTVLWYTWRKVEVSGKMWRFCGKVEVTGKMWRFCGKVEVKGKMWKFCGKVEVKGKM